jgi:prophage antirepressor-like protein
MSTSLQLFHYQSKNIRIITDMDEPWFVASDVAKVLGYRDAANLTRRLDPLDKGYSNVSTPGGYQKVAIINESGIYDAAFRSESEGAKPFRRWVTSEVLPTIQRTGSYVPAQAPVPAPLTGMALMAAAVLEAKKYIDEQSEIIAEQQEVIAELTVKAEFTETFMDAGKAMGVQAAAHLLSSEGIATGEIKLFRWLRDNGWIDKGNQPKQPLITRGLLKLKLSTHVVAVRDGRPVYGRPQVLITPKGLDELRKKLPTHRQLQLSAPSQTMHEIEVMFNDLPSNGKRERISLNPVSQSSLNPVSPLYK